MPRIKNNIKHCSSLQFKPWASKIIYEIIQSKINSSVKFISNHNILAFKDQESFDNIIEIIQFLFASRVNINKNILQIDRNFLSYKKNQDDIAKHYLSSEELFFNKNVIQSQYLSLLLNNKCEIIIGDTIYKIISQDFILIIPFKNLTILNKINEYLNKNQFNLIIELILNDEIKMEISNPITEEVMVPFFSIYSENKDKYIVVENVIYDHIMILYENKYYNCHRGEKCVILINQNKPMMKFATFNERNFRVVSIANVNIANFISSAYGVFSNPHFCDPCSSAVTDGMSISVTNVSQTTPTYDNNHLKFRLCVTTGCNCGLLGSLHNANGIHITLYDKNGTLLSKSPSGVANKRDTFSPDNATYNFGSKKDVCLDIDMFVYISDNYYCELLVKIDIYDACGCYYTNAFRTFILNEDCCEGRARTKEKDSNINYNNKKYRLKQVLTKTYMPFFNSVTCKSKFDRDTNLGWKDESADFISAAIDGKIYVDCVNPYHINYLNDQQWNDDKAKVEFVLNSHKSLRKNSLYGYSYVKDKNGGIIATIQNSFDELRSDCPE
jgi:hypothetical protein